MAQTSTSSSETRPDNATAPGVTPHLALDGRASEAADFYTRAFGAREVGRYEDEENPGRMLHLQMEINGGALMMTDCRGPWEADPAKPRGFNLTLMVTDGEAWWQRAVAAGCKVLMPFERQFWGDRWGMVRDPFGIEWAIDEPAA